MKLLFMRPGSKVRVPQENKDGYAVVVATMEEWYNFLELMAKHNLSVKFNGIPINEEG